jgi:hypothetical protein
MQGAQLDTANKEDLKEELLKIKTKQRKMAEENKAKSQKIIEAAATVGTAAFLSDYLGKIEKDVRKTVAGFSDMSVEDQNKELLKKQGVAGFDIDLVAGIGGVVVGFTEMAGQYSDIFTAAGLGAISAYTSRRLYNSAANAPDEEADA